MWAYLDAWRLKPEPNLECLVFLVGTVQLDHPLSSGVKLSKNYGWEETFSKRTQQMFIVHTLKFNIYTQESTRRSDTIRLSWWLQVCFFSYFWRQSSLRKRFQQELRNTTIAISSSAQSYCWFISAKKTVSLKVGTSWNWPFSTLYPMIKKNHLLMWDLIHWFLP